MSAGVLTQMVYVVVDHICECDIVVGVFSERVKAKRWIKAHKDDLYSAGSTAKRYEALAIEEHELDIQ